MSPTPPPHLSPPQPSPPAAAESSVKMVFEPHPTPRIVGALAEKEVTRVACGQNHTIAVCSDGGVWTWGNGGYGRLGHRVQAVSGWGCCGRLGLGYGCRW